MSSNFVHDLALGHSYEKLALDYLEYDSYIQSDTTKCIKDYDLIIKRNNIETKIEVKADFRAKTTGNLAIEYSCNNKPSGIATSKADYYIIFIIYDTKTHDVYKIPIKDLKKLCKNCLRVSGGDGYRSKMFLLSKFKCRDYIINKI